ncbi:MAG: hypothetical protein WBL61_15145 [Bryobacteraceae bacterium]
MAGTPADRVRPSSSSYAVRTLPLLAALSLFASGPVYRSVSVDESGQLHIVLDSGKEILTPKTPGQVSFGSPLISPDSRTVGWLAMYPDPGAIHYVRDPIPGKLVLVRAGRVLHTFTTEQTFWDWQFQDGGKRVAYSTGPTHGGASECVLRDVRSGAIVARWQVRSGSEAPAWARNLRR